MLGLVCLGHSIILLPHLGTEPQPLRLASGGIEGFLGRDWTISSGRLSGFGTVGLW